MNITQLYRPDPIRMQIVAIRHDSSIRTADHRIGRIKGSVHFIRCVSPNYLRS